MYLARSWELEHVLANYVGSKFCITVANGTDALEIAEKAIGIGPGDEVIVPLGFLRQKPSVIWEPHLFFVMWILKPSI